MLTSWQKALVLNFWADIRERKGESYDIMERIKWNWPSLNEQERGVVFADYKRRREIMKAVSSPNSIPKHVVRCELGWRLYIEAFAETGTAKLFLDKMLKNEPIKWLASNHLTAKGGVLVVKCEELEDIIESPVPSGSLPVEMERQLNAFLRGQWDKKVEAEEKPRPSVHVIGHKKPPPERLVNSAVVTIQQMCLSNKWQARDARAVMRKAGWRKPSNGWQWEKKEAIEIEKKLKEMMK